MTKEDLKLKEVLPNLIKKGLVETDETIKNRRKKIRIYCKNPECFNHYLANHKIKSHKRTEKGQNKLEEVKKI